MRSSWTFSRGSKHTSTYSIAFFEEIFLQEATAAGLEFTRACRNLRCVVTFPNCFRIPFVARVRVFRSSALLSRTRRFVTDDLGSLDFALLFIFARRNSSRRVTEHIQSYYVHAQIQSRKTFRFFLTAKRFQGIRFSRGIN